MMMRRERETGKREASVRLGHKSLRTLMKRSSSWYLPGDFIFNSLSHLDSSLVNQESKEEKEEDDGRGNRL